MHVNGLSFGQNLFTDVDLADDICLPAGPPGPEVIATEAASLGLKLNWQKAIIQALGPTRLNNLPSEFTDKQPKWSKTLSTLVSSVYF